MSDEKSIQKELKEEKKEEAKIEKTVSSLKVISWSALTIGIIAIIIGVVAVMSIPKNSAPGVSSGSTSITPTPIPNVSVNFSLAPIYVNGSLITPPMSLPDAPVITQNQSFGSRLTNINQPFNATELAIINNASNSYFEEAGMMYLNGTIDGVGVQPSLSPMLIVNGKPSVIYLGAISCLYCAENRWAMALALSRFGKFNALFKGYSSFGDLDIPTVYWAPAEYNASSGVDFGNFYNSSYINFISIEYVSPIRAGFELQPLPYFLSKVQSTGSAPYAVALGLITKLNNFQGTPYSIWGKFVVNGADAVDFGNTTPNQPPLPLEYMTHEQVLSQLSNPKDMFALREYAAADLYVAMVCASINNTAPVCSLPAIQKIESINGY
jgi:hypothetical protein